MHWLSHHKAIVWFIHHLSIYCISYHELMGCSIRNPGAGVCPSKFIIKYHVHFYDSTDLKPSMNWLAIDKFHLPTASISVGTPIHGNPSAPPMIPPTKSPPKAVGKTKKNKRNGRPATPPKINRWNLKMIGLGIWFSFSRGPVSSQVNQPLAFWGVPFFCAKKIFQRSRGWLEKLPFQV